MLPIDVLQRVLAAGSILDTQRISIGSKLTRSMTRAAISSIPIHAVLQFRTNCQEATALASTAICSQSPSSVGIDLEFAVPECEDELTMLPSNLARLVPFYQSCSFHVVSVCGLPSRNLALLRKAKWPLRYLGLSSLEEEDVASLCSLLRDLSGRVGTLHIDEFCPDDPTPRQLAPILRALPSSCTQLTVCHVLPVTQGFAKLPATVLSLGRLVLMSERYYHSRVVGMSISYFISHFPSLPNLSTLEVVMGPGHYEQPTWTVSGDHVAHAFCTKFPSLKVLYVHAIVESAESPPLELIKATLLGRGVRMLVCSEKRGMALPGRV